MAERWEDRNRSDVRDGRGYRDRERSDRGITERAGDEVRSWLGDEEAARRRRMDELRYERQDRDWSDRMARSGERAWERTRETAREMTDRDRDGRRGLAEWNDDDRGWDRSRDVRPAYGEGTAWTNSGSSVSGGRGEYWTAPLPPSGYTTWNTPQYGGRDPRATNYTGRGPRGYQRGDERIREDVCDRLTDDPRIDAADIEVQVKNCEVTLAGSVRTREEKRFAEDLIERITGVREVNNNLKVRPADEVLGTARSGASSVLGLSDTPPSTARKEK